MCRERTGTFRVHLVPAMCLEWLIPGRWDMGPRGSSLASRAHDINRPSGSSLLNAGHGVRSAPRHRLLCSQSAASFPVLSSVWTESSLSPAATTAGAAAQAAELSASAHRHLVLLCPPSPLSLGFGEGRRGNSELLNIE